MYCISSLCPRNCNLVYNTRNGQIIWKENWIVILVWKWDKRDLTMRRKCRLILYSIDVNRRNFTTFYKPILQSSLKYLYGIKSNTKNYGILFYICMANFINLVLEKLNIIFLNHKKLHSSLKYLYWIKSNTTEYYGILSISARHIIINIILEKQKS